MDLSEIEKQIIEYEESIRIIVNADDKTAERLKIKVGEPYSIMRPVETKEDAFERLEKLTAPRYFLSCVRVFKRSFPINLRTLTDELNELNRFIEEAEKIPTKHAFVGAKMNLSNAEKFEYLRWKYDYYKNDNIEFTSLSTFYSSALITVYGKYILYKRWIEEEIELLKQNNKETSISSGKNVLSSDSALFDILNKTLTYYRDLGSYEQPINVFDKIDKPEYSDSAVMDIVIHKLRKDNYLLEAPIDSFEIGYCISADGILFINSGGYKINETNNKDADVTLETPISYSNSKNKPKIPEKWSALLYLIELAIKNESLPTNNLGNTSKSAIIKIGQQRGFKKAQYFYTYVRDTNLEKPNAIASEFTADWKKIIIEYSNNNPEIISYLSEK